MQGLTLTDKQQRELDAIEKKSGSLTPAAVVHAAKSCESSLHKLFTWDDNKAADLYRLEQARRVIRIRVVVVDHVVETKKVILRSPSKTTPEADKTRKYVCLSDRKKDGNTEYHRIDTVLSDAKKRELLLLQAYQDLLSFRRKYQVLSELSQVFSAIDDLKERVSA